MTQVMIKRRCGWCGCDMGEKSAEGDAMKYGDTTHGICDACSEKFEQEYDDYKSGQAQGPAPTMHI